MAKTQYILGVPHHHVKRMIIWYLIILLVASGVVYGIYYFKNHNATPIVNAPIKNYTMAGKVTKVDKVNNQITILAGWPQVANGKQTLVYYTRVVKVTKDTTYFEVSKTDTFPIGNKNPLDFLKIGDTITIYGSGNPQQQTTLTAEKIDINH